MSGAEGAELLCRPQGVCVSVPAATITPSIPTPSRASTESTPSTPWAPNFSTIVLVFSGTMSVTTSESIAGIPIRVLVWNTPIRPRPTSPSRMLSKPFSSLRTLRGEGGSGGNTPGAHPVGVGHRGRLPAGEDVDDALRGVGEGQLGPAPGQSHHVRGERDVR